MALVIYGGLAVWHLAGLNFLWIILIALGICAGVIVYFKNKEDGFLKKTSFGENYRGYRN